MKEWALKWKMSCNPDPSKHAQEAVSFTQNVKKFVYSQLVES